MPAEPRWLTLDEVLKIHDTQLAKFGGLAGVKDMGLVESAVNNPRNLFHYGGEEDLIVLAARLCMAIADTQHFNDGNKRTAAVALLAFLEANSYTLDFTNDLSLALLILACVNAQIDHDEFADQIAEHIIELPEDRHELLEKLQMRKADLIATWFGDD